MDKPQSRIRYLLTVNNQPYLYGFNVKLIGYNLSFLKFDIEKSCFSSDKNNSPRLIVKLYAFINDRKMLILFLTRRNQKALASFPFIQLLNRYNKSIPHDLWQQLVVNCFYWYQTLNNII